MWTGSWLLPPLLPTPSGPSVSTALPFAVPRVGHGLSVAGRALDQAIETIPGWGEEARAVPLSLPLPQSRRDSVQSIPASSTSPCYSSRGCVGLQSARPPEECRESSQSMRRSFRRGLSSCISRQRKLERVAPQVHIDIISSTVHLSASTRRHPGRPATSRCSSASCPRTSRPVVAPDESIWRWR